MSPSSSPSEPFAFLVARGAVAEATSASAWLQAMLDAEAALAGAQADVGEIPRDAAAAIERACHVEQFDVDDVFEEAALGGNPAIPLVPRLRALAGRHGSVVHRGATSQDIVDTATLLVVHRCAGIVKSALAGAGRTAVALGTRFGAADTIARTLGQHAVPTTFMTVTGRWTHGLAEAAAALDRPELRIALGGPAGDGASFASLEVAERVAERLGLPWAPTARHTERSTTAAIAGAWGLAAAAVSKVALDIVLLAQSDIGEVSELAEGAGGSSSMAHKRNPVAAICARAAAMQAPGLVATLLHAAGSHEFERAAGAWHAEWPALNNLLRATGSAAEWLLLSLQRLVVHPDRMVENLARSKEAME